MDGGIIACADKIISVCNELKALLTNDGAFDAYKAKLLGELQRLSLSFDKPETRVDAKLGDVAWITVNGTHVPLKDGVAVGGPFEGVDFSKSGDKAPEKPKKPLSPNYSSPYPIEQISAEGVNPPCRGFTKRNLRLHKDVRHKAQYADMTDEQFENHAKKFLQKKCGPDIWGYRKNDGCVCRFNRLTGEMALGYPGGDIKTCFFPTKKGTRATDIDIEYAIDYFNRCKRKESYD